MFTDDIKSCYSWVYPLKTKDQVLSCFLEWKALVEKSSGKTLRHFILLMKVNTLLRLPLRQRVHVYISRPSLQNANFCRMLTSYIKLISGHAAGKPLNSHRYPSARSKYMQKHRQCIHTVQHATRLIASAQPHTRCIYRAQPHRPAPSSSANQLEQVLPILPHRQGRLQ